MAVLWHGQGTGGWNAAILTRFTEGPQGRKWKQQSLLVQCHVFHFIFQEQVEDFFYPEADQAPRNQFKVTK
jgi:hypothetical protein